MKLNQLFLGLLGLMTVTFVACDDDDDYTRATISGNQVYFSNELPGTQEMSTTANSFTIPVNRQETTEAITVPLQVSGEGVTSGIYSVPTSVSFPAGSNTANLVINYDPAKLEFGDYKNIRIQLGEEGYTTPYGLSVYDFEAGASQWTEWMPYNEEGTADYYYTNFFSGIDEDCDFYVRHNTIVPNEHQFRIDNIMAGVDLILDYDDKTGYVTYFHEGDTKYNHSSYGEVMFADYNYYWTVVRGEDATPVYGSFDEKKGIISIPLCYYVSAGYFGYADEYIYIDGIDRSDATCAVQYGGKLITPDESTWIVANVTLGEDVTSAYVALVPGELEQETFAQIVAGTYTPLQEITASGEVKFNAENYEDGLYTLVVVSMIDGEPQEYDYSTFEFTTTASAWNSLGTGLYTEDAIVELYYDEEVGPQPVTYEVEIEENAETPGLYRLVNPYGAAFPLNREGDWDASRNWNIEVNCEDAEGVYIDLQPTGLDWGNGLYYLYSLASYYLDSGYDLSYAKEKGVTGSLVDGHITFPVQTLLQTFEGDETIYYANQQGAFEIVLPSAVEKSHRKAIKGNVRPHKSSLHITKDMRIVNDILLNDNSKSFRQSKFIK